MAGPARPERSRSARSSRQLSRFYHSINPDRVFGTHSWRKTDTSISLIMPFIPKSSRSLGHPRIIDAVLIDDHRADESTEFEECVPITTIARQSGGLDRQNGANPAFTDRGEQLLEPRSYDAAAKSTEIIINNLHVAPAEPPRPLNQTVLASPALGIVCDLIGCRLPYIDDGAPSKMISRDLRHDRPPAGVTSLPARRLRRLLPPEGFRATPVPSRAEAPTIRSARRQCDEQVRLQGPPFLHGQI